MPPAESARELEKKPAALWVFRSTNVEAHCVFANIARATIGITLLPSAL